MENIFGASSNQIYLINGDEIRDKESFLRVVSIALKFPDYFGHNWDALNDCLTDMSCIDINHPIYMVYKNSKQFSEESPEDFHIAMEVIAQAIGYLNRESIQVIFALV